MDEERHVKPVEWRPRDFAVALPAKVLKRGPDFPLVVQLSVARLQYAYSSGRSARWAPTARSAANR